MFRSVLGMNQNNPVGLDPEWVRIGETLRTIRESRGLLLGECASAMDISYAYLSNIEAGRKRLTPRLLSRAVEVLGIRPIALIRPGYFEDAA